MIGVPYSLVSMGRRLTVRPPDEVAPGRSGSSPQIMVIVWPRLIKDMLKLLT
jgi:hypothetical protein